MGQKSFWPASRRGIGAGRLGRLSWLVVGGSLLVLLGVIWSYGFSDQPAAIPYLAAVGSRGALMRSFPWPWPLAAGGRRGPDGSLDVAVVGSEFGAQGETDRVDQELEIRYGVVGELTTLNPLLAQTAPDRLVEQHLFHFGLLRPGADLTPQANLATQWEFSTDGLTWTFLLRDDVFWHDGTPLTAADAVYTLDLLISAGGDGPWAAEFQWLRRVQAIDDHTLELHLWEPYAPLLAALTVPLLPAHLYDGVDWHGLPQAAGQHQPIGYGPFYLDRWEPGQWVRLSAVSPYWDDGPHLQRVFIRVFADAQQAANALAAGEIDYWGDIPQPYWEQLQAGAQDDTALGQYRFFKYYENGYTYIGLNHQHPFFRRRVVRQALLTAMDRHRYIKEALGGGAVVVNSHYTPASLAHHDEIQRYHYNPGLADQLLDQAGFLRPGAQGETGGAIRRHGESGQLFSFTVLMAEGSKELAEVLALARADLAAVGVEMTVESLPANVLLDRLQRGQFEAYALGWNLGLDPDATLFFHSRAAAVDAQGQTFGFNDIRLRHPEIDRLLDQGRQSLDLGERRQVYRDLHRLLNTELPYLFLYAKVRSGAIHGRYAGVVETPLGLILPQRWYVPPP